MSYIQPAAAHLVPAALWFQNIMLSYVVGLLVIYALLYFVAIRPFGHRMRLHNINVENVSDDAVYPPIALILPAYNEEAVIVDCVTTAMALNYPALQVLVVCDGPKDRTLEVLIEAFSLKEKVMRIREDIPTKPVLGVWTNPQYPLLTVLLKANGGKADALNVGLNAARAPLVCCCDADTLIEPDALRRLARPFWEEPTTIATAGALALTNGSSFEGSTAVSKRAPNNWLARIQTVEYVRAFYFGRMGFERLGAMLLISGAFGLFNRHALASVGGYNHATQGEDMELVVRLHRHYRGTGRKYKVAYVPDAVAWTEAPEDLGSLKSQRMRWQRGLCETLWLHRGMMFSKTAGAPAWIGYPYFLLYECLSPVVELLGYLGILILVLAGFANWGVWLTMLLFALSASLLSTFAALYEQQKHQPLVSRRMDLVRIMSSVISEMFVFRPLCLVWRFRAIGQFLRKEDVKWKALPRKGFDVSGTK